MEYCFKGEGSRTIVKSSFTTKIVPYLLIDENPGAFTLKSKKSL